MSEKRAAKAAFIRRPCDDTLIAFRRLETLVKREVKQAKRVSWRNFCDTVTSSTPSPILWRTLRRLQTPFVARVQPFFTPTAILSDPSAKANALAAHYATHFNTAPPPRVDSLAMILPLTLSLTDDSFREFNVPFQLRELDAVLLALTSTSPGFDKIHNQHLSHLPLCYKHHVLNLFNRSFLSDLFPSDWKRALVIPIFTPLKPLTSVSSYRPISLLSCLSKVLEKLVSSRLSYFLESSGKLRSSQGGFQ